MPKKAEQTHKGRIYKPKKPIFIHYHEYYSVVRRAHPSWTPTQLWRHISRKWSNLKDKSMYQQLAREDRDRYHREMLATGKSKGRFLKYPRAFNFYQQERYQQMKQDQPDKSMAEITAMINKEWRATQDKSKWEKLEAQEKEKWTAARKEMEKMQNI
uniref:HMG box domain-containing protein n=1 Tax=Ditylenchus dipsaci TaxID=166011 RepID=A0A915ELF7_9BILA